MIIFFVIVGKEEEYREFGVGGVFEQLVDAGGGINGGDQGGRCGPSGRLRRGGGGSWSIQAGVELIGKHGVLHLLVPHPFDRKRT
ncbi:hypothetical protein FF2_035885 [Malus domestica]